MGKKLIYYINTALAIALAAILIIMLRPLFIVSKKGAVGETQPKVAIDKTQPPAEPTYDIEKAKAALGVGKGTGKEFSDFTEMYEKSPKATVGGNIVESWSKVKPEDKARLSEGFDKQIVKAQETLKENPKDKHAKNILYISAALKKMAADGFNYKFKSRK